MHGLKHLRISWGLCSYILCQFDVYAVPVLIPTAVDCFVGPKETNTASVEFLAIELFPVTHDNIVKHLAAHALMKMGLSLLLRKELGFTSLVVPQ